MYRHKNTINLFASESIKTEKSIFTVWWKGGRADCALCLRVLTFGSEARLFAAVLLGDQLSPDYLWFAPFVHFSHFLPVDSSMTFSVSAFN